MKINWKARFKNKTFVITFATTVVAFVYQILALLDIVPKFSESSTANLITMVVNIFAMLGIVVDGTTQGVSDSDRAMTYYQEKEENKNE